MKTLSIKARLTAAMLVITLVGMVLATVISYFIAQGVILNETLEKTKNLVASESEIISGWLDSQKMLVKASGVSLFLQNDKSTIKEFCAAQKKNNSQLSDMFVGFSDDSGIFGSTDTLPEWKATQRKWFQDAMAANGEIIVTSPYQDSQTGQMCITIAQRVDGKIENLDAAIGVDVLIDSLLDIVSGIQVSDNGYAFLADQNGLIIAHPDKKYLPTADSSFSMLDDESYAEVFRTQNSGVTSIKIKDYDNVERYIVPYTIKSSGWTLYVSVPSDTIFAAVNSKIPITILTCALLIILAVVFISVFIKRIIVKPVAELKEVADRLINGDLNVSINSVSNDEIGMATQAFVKVTNIINTVIDDIETMSNEHQSGDFEYKMDELKYAGDFKKVAIGINATVFMYVGNFLGVMNLLQGVGEGNFRTPVNKYPGKQAVGNDIIEAFRSKLIHVCNEINGLRDAAINGNLSVRAEASGFEGDWQIIISGMNQLLEAVDAPLVEAQKALTSVSEGRLDVKVTGKYNGQFKKMSDSINTTIEVLYMYIQEISSILNELASDNFNVRISREYVGSFSDIKTSLNAIIDRLNSVMKEIGQAAEQVTLGATQISESSMTLSQGAADQANSVQELNETMNQIYAQTAKNVENSSAANSLSSVAKDNAKQGNIEMSGMLDSMADINDASQNIAKIIKVIEDIAFQTNLLALNASVEAARAGMHGKGFSVVADEVRSLATKSKEAANETAGLIERSISKVNDGSRIANKTAETLTKIVEGIESVAEINNKIEASSKEQAASILHVNDGISRISQVTQGNSSMSEESAAAAEELSSQAEVLRSMINRFSLEI